MNDMFNRLTARVMTSRVVNDRKGVTALEYALIAAAVVAVVLVAYQAMFGRLEAFINSIVFTGKAG